LAHESMVASSEGSWMEISMLKLDELTVRGKDLLTNLGFDRDGLNRCPITHPSLYF